MTFKFFEATDTPGKIGEVMGTVVVVFVVGMVIFITLSTTVFK